MVEAMLVVNVVDLVNVVNGLDLVDVISVVEVVEVVEMVEVVDVVNFVDDVVDDMFKVVNVEVEVPKDDTVITVTASASYEYTGLAQYAVLTFKLAS